ncbi:MAG: efflux transporter outer membrane subunit [Woeseiaceae bacterium]|nr:efflux transporter outer membrane subunit [Woeseiaceae bacterium]
MMWKTAYICCATLIVGGCAVGNEYVAPEDSVAARWIEPMAGEASGDLPQRWWARFQDDVLNDHLERAALQNLDIKTATARIDEARALRGIARSAFWPQVSLGASFTQFEQSIDSPSGAGALISAGISERDIDFYNASLDASWEIDLFGSTRRRVDEANANLEGTIAEREAVRLTALAETAGAYFELRGSQQRLAIIESNIAAQQRTLDLTRRKVDAGLGRKIDQLRAEAQLDAIAAEVPALRASIRASTYRLGVLTGQRPEDMVDEVAVSGTLPAAPRAIPVGIRADLLKRRPDIAAAERQLAAAAAATNIARTDFFPRLVLNASYGFEAENADDIGSSNARTTGLVPFVSWPVFQGGRLRANLESAEARTQQAALQYEKSVLTALADAESAITAYAEELRSFERLDSAAEASREAASIAQQLYEKGLADFLTVLDADQRRDQAEDQRTQSHTRLMLNLVRVYKALGGGWDV